MKNFPHQYSDINRFRGTLDIIRELTQRAGNVLDNGVLGYELARAGVYHFRGSVTDLEARIQLEQRKPRGKQGARTAAREGRRTLELLGLVNAMGAVTASGTDILEMPAGSAEEVLIWRRSLIAMSLMDDAANVSHPMRILLRLLADHGPLARIELALALEAQDDGEVEYRRLVSLLPVRDAIDRGALQISQSMLDNAVKILPALTLQLGMAVDRGDGLLAITEIGEAALRFDCQVGDIAIEQREQQPRRTARRGRPIVAGRHMLPGIGDFVGLSRAEQIEAMRLRSERTARHEDVVQKIAAAFRLNFEVLEDTLSYDVLLVPRNQRDIHILLEIKTLDLDEVAQTNRAVGQLFWYLWQYVRPTYDDARIELGVIFDRAPSDETSSYLQSLSIASFYCEGLRLEGCNDGARELLPQARDVPEDYATPEGG